MLSISIGVLMIYHDRVVFPIPIIGYNLSNLLSIKLMWFSQINSQFLFLLLWSPVVPDAVELGPVPATLLAATSTLYLCVCV